MGHSRLDPAASPARQMNKSPAICKSPAKRSVKVVKSADLMTMMGAKGPIARQEEKEQAFKRKLGGTQKLSWWGVAATSDPAASRADPSGAGPSKPALTEEQRALARGRIRAQQERKVHDAWRDAAIDDFLGNQPLSRETREPPATPTIPSPGTIHAKYGRQSRLPPLRHPLLERTAGALAKEAWTQDQAAKAKQREGKQGLAGRAALQRRSARLQLAPM